MKKYATVLAFLLLTLFVLWYINCLPEPLFQSPTSLVLLDRNDELLGAHVAKDEQWRFPKSDFVNPKFEKALITFEDKRFYNHIGVDFLAIGRALKSNFNNNKIVSGASTLSMQTIRMSRSNKRRSYLEKVIELIVTTRLEIKYTKKEILSFYASHAPFGGNVVGLDAATWKYFGKDQHNLSWAEAAMLAVLPNAPSLIHLGKNRDVLLKKRNRLLNRLHKNKTIDSTTCYLAKLEPLPEKTFSMPKVSPHLLGHLLNQNLTTTVKSTLDKHLQSQVLALLRNQQETLKEKAIHNASVLIIDTKSGEVRTYVGNTEENQNKHQNEVDMIQSHRSTGSILKPLLYFSMLDEGKILPNSIIDDTPKDFQGYNPKNYYKNYDGVVEASQVVSRSLNIPSVNMLQSYGTHRFLQRLRNLGMKNLEHTAKHYGLSLILGGAEVSPWELAIMYTQLCQSLLGDFHSIHFNKEKINSSPLKIDKTASWYMLEAMLNTIRPNEEASWRVFSSSNKVAWKTGTSFGGRDAWAVGCHPDYVVVVWAGNSNGEGRPDLSGTRTAAPILFEVFDLLKPSKEWFPFPKSETTLLEVCSQSGYSASEHCGETSTQRVSKQGLNSKTCGFCKRIQLDATGTYSVENTNYPPFDRVTKKQFILTPLQSFYYQQKNNNYVSTHQKFKNQDGNSSMSITYPRHNSRIYLPKINSKERSTVIFKALSTDNNSVLYWNIDQQYIGRTQSIHQITVKPKIGKHTLTLINESGYRAIVDFEIVE